MPTYVYGCKSCDNQFEEYRSMSERSIPTETPCVECKGEISQRLTPIVLTDRTGRMDNRKVPTDFKNLMDGMHKSHKQEFKT